MNTSASKMDLDTLRHRINDIDDDIIPHIRLGFHLLANVDPTKREEFIQNFLNKMGNRESIDTREVAKELEISQNIVGDVFTAVSVPVGATVDLAVSQEDFLELAGNRLFDEADAEVARNVIRTVMAQKERLRAALDTSSLANAVLPSFRSLIAEVDLRLKFDDDGKLEGNVPIAVIYLATDVEDPLSFQASRDDLARMIDRLQKAAVNMDVAANLSLSTRK